MSLGDQQQSDLTVDALVEAAAAAVANPPPPLPAGWLLKESQSQPGSFYYYNMDTSESAWEAPATAMESATNIADAAAAALAAASDNVLKRSVTEESIEKVEPQVTNNKKQRTTTTTTTTTPDQVHALHILRKHRDSKRPASWRSNGKPITISRDEAIEEIQGIIDILKEEAEDVESLTATFKELAKEESDCSSAKRGGDLGVFGRKKMRPEFEEAAFALQVGGMSDIVETSSGVHVILRVA